MNGKERHDDEERLARLYREQGDIEPGPGVDQRIRIRARARAGERSSGMPRPAHWLGGVAVAASLFVVVSIVTNIQPPEAELPSNEANRSSAPAPASDVDSAESSAFESSSPRRSEEKVETEPTLDRLVPTLSAPPPEPLMQRRMRDSAADDAARTAREQYEAIGASRQSGERRAQARDSLEPAGEPELDLVEEQLTGPEGALWLIDRLISVGNPERARIEVEAFRERYPEREIPGGLIDRLEALEAAAGGG